MIFHDFHQFHRMNVAKNMNIHSIDKLFILFLYPSSKDEGYLPYLQSNNHNKTSYLYHIPYIPEVLSCTWHNQERCMSVLHSLISPRWPSWPQDSGHCFHLRKLGWNRHKKNIQISIFQKDKHSSL